MMCAEQPVCGAVSSFSFDGPRPLLHRILFGPPVSSVQVLFYQPPAPAPVSAPSTLVATVVVAAVIAVIPDHNACCLRNSVTTTQRTKPVKKITKPSKSLWDLTLRCFTSPFSCVRFSFSLLLRSSSLFARTVSFLPILYFSSPPLSWAGLEGWLARVRACLRDCAGWERPHVPLSPPLSPVQ
jgi:hypothetical protein